MTTPSRFTPEERAAIQAALTLLGRLNAVEKWAYQQPGEPYYIVHELVKHMLYDQYGAQFVGQFLEFYLDCGPDVDYLETFTVDHLVDRALRD